MASGKPADANCIRSHLAEVPSDAGADTLRPDRRAFVSGSYKQRSDCTAKSGSRRLPSPISLAERRCRPPTSTASSLQSRRSKRRSWRICSNTSPRPQRLRLAGGSALERLTAALSAISQLHEHRLENDSKQHELVAAAVRENWAVALSYADRIRGLVRAIIAAGQASGELRPGSPMAMTCCLLEAMDGYLNPSRINAATVRPTFDEMMDFCAGALRHVPWGQSIDLAADLRPKAVAQG